MPNRDWRYPEYSEALRKQDVEAAEDTNHMLENLPPRPTPDAPMTLQNMAWYIDQRHGRSEPEQE